jgi:PPOX class probable F420-dependent enzyme
MIDWGSVLGSHALERLNRDAIVWLTTVGADGTPQPRPVWFIWQQDHLLIYSRPGTYKLAHLSANPRVALHFDSDGLGGDIVVLTGKAQRHNAAPPADQVQAYIDKYIRGIQDIGMTPQSFAGDYSVPLRVDPDHLRGDF